MTEYEIAALAAANTSIIQAQGSLMQAQGTLVIDNLTLYYSLLFGGCYLQSNVWVYSVSEHV
jgi:hypothetical protein